ncbi:MAG TPA: hypothetical protein VES73_11290 [Lamprocystis sp. (in: g-proteobacteria)]|nr:hypothetical protein [Lamprocystis sp. (in: g-proteobacteria)]
MQNHLFIGLGGQGGRTLGELLKVRSQRAKDSAALQQQGVRTEFLAIDSSDDVRNDRRAWTVFGTDLALDPSDWLILKRPGAGTIGNLALRSDIEPLGLVIASASWAFSVSSISRAPTSVGVSVACSLPIMPPLSAAP